MGGGIVKTRKISLLMLLLLILSMVFPSCDVTQENPDETGSISETESAKTSSKPLDDSDYSDFTMSIEQTVYPTNVQQIKLILTAVEPGKAIRYDDAMTLIMPNASPVTPLAVSGSEILYETGIPAADEYATATVYFLLYKTQLVEMDEYTPGSYRILMATYDNKYVDFELVSP